METQAQWGIQVQNFKDSEKQYGIDPYSSELLARDMLSFLRYRQIRQIQLFKQQRGEEYEKFVEALTVTYGDAVLRAVGNEDLWAATLKLANR
jgi:hypothetical protein